MTQRLIENYYLINLFFAVGISSAMLIYMGRFSHEDPKANAFKRLLLGVMAWAFFDLIISQTVRISSPQEAFEAYRYLSCLFLFYPAAACELILSLQQPVTGRHRWGLYLPFALLYLWILVFPSAASGKTFGISSGNATLLAPWNVTFKVCTVVLSSVLLGRLWIFASNDPDSLARKEKKILFFGGAATLIGTALSQVARSKLGPEVPWFANFATAFTSLAAFWGMKRYGRVLSPKDLYETTIRIAPNGMVHLIEGKITWANQAMADLIEVEKPAALNGTKIADLIGNQEDAQSLMQSMEGTGIKNMEIGVIRSNGQIAACLLSVRLLKKGTPRFGSLAVFVDITEKEALEKKLARSRNMETMGMLAGGVAHDLNNVLSGISSYPELLLLDLPDESPMKKPLETIRNSGRKAAAIVQDLLTLARREVMVKEIVNINEIITDYLASPEHEKAASYHTDCRVSLDLAADLANIKGSPIHLKKTVMNIVSNALESQPDGGSVLVSTRNQYLDRPVKGYDTVEEGDYVVLSIRDEGIGIDPEEMDRIFEPFYTKKVLGRSGTGLGMAVVWGTVQDHAGYIRLESCLGKGSVFQLYFPATRENEVSPREALPIEKYKGNGQTILIVDDVADQRLIATKTLERLGYTVCEAESGETAVAILKNRSVDLVLLDMIMEPGMDGLETFKAIRRLHPGQKAAIASGFSESERLQEAQRLGAGPYLKKPYTVEGLGIAVKKALEG